MTATFRMVKTSTSIQLATLRHYSAYNVLLQAIGAVVSAELLQTLLWRHRREPFNDMFLLVVPILTLIADFAERNVAGGTSDLSSRIGLFIDSALLVDEFFCLSQACVRFGGGNSSCLR